MYAKLNWLEHVERFDQVSKRHPPTNSKLNKINYRNVDSTYSKGRIKRASDEFGYRLTSEQIDRFFTKKKCRSPESLVNKNIIRNNDQMIKSNQMHSPAPHSITASMPNIQIGLLLLICSTIAVKPIECINRLPSSESSIDLVATRSSLIYSSPISSSLLSRTPKHSSKNRFMRTIQFAGSPTRLRRRSSLISYGLNDEDAFSSETIVELRPIDRSSNQMTLNKISNYLDSSLVVNNRSELEINETSSNDKSTVIEQKQNEQTDSITSSNNQYKSTQEAQLKEQEEQILNEIDQINGGHVCSALNKQTHFKTKGSTDASKENRDKKYWLLVKALEPKFVKMPSLANQMQPNQQIKNYYRELIEKLELITSILYDNVDQINAIQHLQLMRKIIREISLLHPHILRARLVSLHLNNHNANAYRKRRHSSSLFDFNNLEANYNVELDDDEKLTNVPFRRSTREDSVQNNMNRLNADNDDQISEQGKTTAEINGGEQWLRAKNIFFYMRGEQEAVHEFQDVTLTTKREHVSWLDIREVEERSGTLKEFDQLLTQGHLFVMNEKERLFSGYTGIYFDCAMRRWLLSYTSLLVSCNQCSSKRKFISVSVDNELEMRLIGLLSVDIDLETVDVNQCETPKSDQPEVMASDALSNQSVLDEKMVTSSISDSTNNQQTNYKTSDATKLKPNFKKYFRHPFDSVLMQPSLQINSHQSNDKRLSDLQLNDSLLIGQPQRLVNSPTALTSLNHSLSITDKSNKLASNRFRNRLMLYLGKTNKCHQATSQCHFVPNGGIRKGNYNCKCKRGYFAVLHQFSGLEVERAWEYQQSQAQNALEKAHTYDRMYICKKCSPGCDTCVDLTPCLSTYNWAFRISLLTISILCIFLIFLLTYYIYKYRKVKVFKVASPTFLSLTLLGCAIMYAEMIFIFPVLNSGFCIMTKIARHLGFCLTYSALLLKTWRVSLTYRVKSAHKLKLTDRQLLQWLFPILLVMSIFLGTWIISDPPKEIIIQDWNKLKFAICEYNWFDHSLAIGEFLFLLWGIKVCYNVRNAESFFNEAKYITWAIYNIAAVNILMILIHIMILPNAGPDLKYFLGFVRTQLSTTTTILLIFGPKFYRLIKGEGDSWNSNFARRGINASFSLNGVVHEELTDLYQENEELKEQVHKLATQVELMRLRQMQVNNRHLKSKHTIGSGASAQVSLNSTVVSSANVTGLVGLAANANTASSHFHTFGYNQLNPQVDSAGIGLVAGLVGGVVGGTGVSGLAFSPNQSTAIQRVSPAAELQSEKV